METIHRKQNNKRITLICSTLAVKIRFKNLKKNYLYITIGKI